MSDTDSDKNQKANIFDMETQNFGDRHSGASNSIYDVETQILSTDAPKQDSNRLSRPNVQNKIVRNSAMDIHNLETQNYESNISELETQRNEENIESVTARRLTTSIYDVETQNFVSNSGKGHIEVQESGKNESRVRDLDQIDIENSNTQRLNDERITEDIFDMETQLELNNAVKNISDLETQLEPNDIFIEERTDKDNDGDNVADSIKNEANYENMESPNSRSSSPRSLNLSSPDINEEIPPSPLNESGHLLESTELLEFFGEGIDQSDKVQTYNIVSTPKSKAKVSSETENNANGNRSNTPDNNDIEDDVENIFDAPTQRINSESEALASKDANEKYTFVQMREKCRTPQSEQIDDFETDAEEYVEEFAEKQRKFSGTLNKSCNESAGKRNNPGTSVNSEDIFDVLTQSNSDRVIDDTSKSPINRQSETRSEPDTVDNAIHDQYNRVDTLSENIDDMPTQLILPQETSISSLKNNQNDMNDMELTQIINTNKDVPNNALNNLDQEDLSYEMAPTQRIDEKEINSEREKAVGSSNANVNDSIEQNLNEMFDDIRSENILECQQMSTQHLEKILDSSASDNDLSTSATDNVLQTQLRKTKRTASQNSDVSFSNVTTRRKKNIKDTQELAESMKTQVLSENVNSSQTSKAGDDKTDDDSVATTSGKREKRRPLKMKNKPDMDPTSDDNGVNVTNETKEIKHLRRTKSIKQSDEAASEQVLEEDSSKVTVDDTEEHSAAEPGVCAPCPSTDGQGAETLGALLENDDDILSRLPLVRISGTLSNPGSPSVSSTSTVHTVRSKRSVAKNRNKNVPSKKSRRKRTVKDPKQDEHDPLLDDHLPSPKSRRSKIPDAADSSEDSDCDLHIRFQQIAERMLNKQPSNEKSRNEVNVQNVSKPVVPDKKRSTRASNISKGSKQNADAESINSSPRASSRMTRHSNRQNESSFRVSQKENSAESTAEEFTKSETTSVVKRKRSVIWNDSMEDINLKKRKENQAIKENATSTPRARRSIMKAADRQSPNILERSAENRSRENSPVIESKKYFEDSKTISKAAAMKSQKTVLRPKKDENVDSRRSNVRQTKRNINETQTATNTEMTANEDNGRSKQVKTKEQTKMNSTEGKILKIVLNPIKNVTSSIRDESQEVEMIMETILKEVDDKNLSIRQNSSARIFKKESGIRRWKQANTDPETDSTLTESSLSSDADDGNSSVSLVKRARLAKSSVPSRTRSAAAEKKEVFKRPTRANRAINSVLDSSMESTSSSSLSSRSSVSSTPKVLRSSARRKKPEMDQDTRGMSVSLETMSSDSMSPRTRRSMSASSSSTSLAHRILFTGVTEDYSKIIKTLGEYMINSKKF